MSGSQRYNRNPRCFNCFSPSFFTIYQSEYSSDGPPRLLDGCNRLESRSSCRDNVFDDDGTVPSSKRALDQLTCSVSFCFLSDRKST